MSAWELDGECWLGEWFSVFPHFLLLFLGVCRYWGCWLIVGAYWFLTFLRPCFWIRKKVFRLFFPILISVDPREEYQKGAHLYSRFPLCVDTLFKIFHHILIVISSYSVHCVVLGSFHAMLLPWLSGVVKLPFSPIGCTSVVSDLDPALSFVPLFSTLCSYTPLVSLYYLERFVGRWPYVFVLFLVVYSGRIGERNESDFVTWHVVGMAPGQKIVQPKGTWTTRTFC